jgi:hypothetical protein
MSKGQVIADAVTGIGVWIAFYYGLTGFTCAWTYRHQLTANARNLWLQGILPVLGGLILWFAGAWTIWSGWDVATDDSYTTWRMPFPPHWRVGGVFLVGFVSALIGLIAYLLWRLVKPVYFTGETFRQDMAVVGTAPIVGATDVVPLEAFDVEDPQRPHPYTNLEGGPAATGEVPQQPTTSPPSDESPTTAV